MINDIHPLMVEIYRIMKEDKMYGLKHTIEISNGDEIVFNIKIKQIKKKDGN